MKFVLIDLGTNSIRFDVYEYFRQNHTEILYSEKNMIQLGKGMFGEKSRPRISKQSETLLIKSLQCFQTQLKAYPDIPIFAFATCAMRIAENGSAVKKIIQEKIGIPFHILSGKEEAKTIALGIHSKQKIELPHILLDMGGGSTEFGFFSERNSHYESVVLGSQHLKQQWFSSLPPSDKNISAFETHVHQILPKLNSQFLESPIVGSSGTILGIQKLCQHHFKKKAITLNQLKKLESLLLPLDLAETEAFPGMEAKRARSMLGGIIFLKTVMAKWNSTSLVYTPFALKEGLLVQQVKKFQKISKTNDSLLKLQTHFQSKTKPPSWERQWLATIKKLSSEGQRQLEQRYGKVCRQMLLYCCQKSMSELESWQYIQFFLEQKYCGFFNRSEQTFLLQLMKKTLLMQDLAFEFGSAVGKAKDIETWIADLQMYEVLQRYASKQINKVQYKPKAKLLCIEIKDSSLNSLLELKINFKKHAFEQHRQLTILLQKSEKAGKQ